MSIWEEMLKVLESGQSLICATIVDQNGSSPRKSGAHMAVLPEGKIFGTVGGGKLEAEAIERAVELLKQEKSGIYEFKLTGKDAALTDMICGGVGEVFLDFVSYKEENNLQILRRVIQCAKDRTKAWLITSLDGAGRRQQCLVEGSKAVTGDFECDENLYLKMLSGPAKFAIHTEVLKDMRVFIEPLQPNEALWIFGGGHCGQKLAEAMKPLNFQIHVVDDREEFASTERFPGAVCHVVDAMADCFSKLEVEPDAYIVIVTRGHMHDQVVLTQALRTPATYIGMIGSRHKRDLVYKHLKQSEGFADADFERVCCPIGINIDAETPEEIAISIAAELIQTRAKVIHGRY